MSARVLDHGKTSESRQCDPQSSPQQATEEENNNARRVQAAGLKLLGGAPA